jgi:hypothetical protein
MIDDNMQLTPEMVRELYELCARRETMSEDSFADELAEILEISRTMLDEAVAITKAGLRDDVEEGRVTFEQAHDLARVRN